MGVGVDLHRNTEAVYNKANKKTNKNKHEKRTQTTKK